VEGGTFIFAALSSEGFKNILALWESALLAEEVVRRMEVLSDLLREDCSTMGRLLGNLSGGGGRFSFASTIEG